MGKEPFKCNQCSYVCASCGTLFVQEQGHILADLEFVSIMRRRKNYHPNTQSNAKGCISPLMFRLNARVTRHYIIFWNIVRDLQVAVLVTCISFWASAVQLEWNLARTSFTEAGCIIRVRPYFLLGFRDFYFLSFFLQYLLTSHHCYRTRVRSLAMLVTN